ncbi:uncharacterized protein LOC129608067 [Condylostylus longicornis]|uniref:uncharacterized protein LOC129608067 n=1 Tax=Condylostylus longicornis TaxID=2530218 RepID=UPI00244DF94D|nr:uncharacterized protein LOC129608067 [Condylostylus longicornis]
MCKLNSNFSLILIFCYQFLNIMNAESSILRKSSSITEENKQDTASNYKPSTMNESNVIISYHRHRSIRDINNFEEDEVGWTNINEQVDMTIPLILSHFQELGMTHFKLPEVKEGISISPLFLTYSAELTLFNGAVYNIEGIYRYGNAMMTYRDKAFQVRLNLIIKKLQFEYDFIAKAMIVSVMGGVVGHLEDIIVSCDFSVDVRDPILQLNDFQIERFGNIIVQLNHNRVVQELSTFVLTPITNLFRDRITTTISEDIKGTIQETLVDFSNKDQLGIKKFTRQVLSGLIRASLNSSEKSNEEKS